jgi:hypothetical protein
VRLLFFILMLVNAAVFAYLFFQEPGVRPSKPIPPALNADRILLVQTESAAGKRGVVSTTTTCLSWRGLTPEALTQARAALEKLADGVKFSQPAGDEYWIYMTPLKNKRDGDKKLAELKALSIADGVLLVESGKWQYAISFAAFPTEDDAIVRLNQLKEKGVKTAKILKREAAGDSLLLQSIDEKSVAAIKKLQADYAETSLLPVDCKAP